jgi:hypothetical protein
MDDSVKMFMNQHARDVLLIHVLAETHAIKYLLTNIYAKTFEIPYEEAVKVAKNVGVDGMQQTLMLVAKYGNLDVDGLKESLGL